MERRKFLQSTATCLGALACSSLYKRNEWGAESKLIRGNYLELAPGLKDTVVDEAGRRMSDGFQSPERPDGMGVFPLSNDEFVLMRNHEIFMESAPKELESFAYDPDTGGGVTRLVFNRDGDLLRSHYSLVGTAVNCAGGRSPWGWLSCEEAFSRRHGFVFLCDPNREMISRPLRMDSLGKFVHEAAVMDAESQVTYMTEDQGDSCLYRFVPVEKVNSAEDYVSVSGRFEALMLSGESDIEKFDTNAMLAGEIVSAEWRELPGYKNDPASIRDSLRKEAQKAGAVVFNRGEGLWLENGTVYFTATSGGRHGKGQIFSWTPIVPGASSGALKLWVEGDGENLHFPDNIALGPGGVLYVCEDNGSSNHLYALRPNGSRILIARNHRNASEFAGVCFSPCGRHLFVNLQEQGITLRISGDFGG